MTEVLQGRQARVAAERVHVRVMPRAWNARGPGERPWCFSHSSEVTRGLTLSASVRAEAHCRAEGFATWCVNVLAFLLSFDVEMVSVGPRREAPKWAQAEKCTKADGHG